jgi:RND family efflux transporter MFP subunit
MVIILGSLAAGSAITYVVVHRGGETVTTPAPQVTMQTPSSSGTAVRQAGAITLTSEAIARAGIETAEVVASAKGGRLRIPAVVQPNSYHTVTVTPLVAGRITRVAAELGQTVQRGQTLAEIYSPELSEAQTQFISARAELDAHERELRRTERLVEIGSASRQELERLHAEHTAAESMLQTRRSRLMLLGMTDTEINDLSEHPQAASTVRVAAPIAGVITARSANPGLNVDSSGALFTIVDLSTVWVVGDLYEKDLAQVRTGSPAVVRVGALGGLTLEGKVSYVDPEIKAETRTAQIRVEVPNRNAQLRLGMYVDLEIGELADAGGVEIPRSAVQTVGDRTVVYVVNPAIPGQFVAREVQLGASRGDMVEVISGVAPRDIIVSKGSFSLRAEQERTSEGGSVAPPAVSAPVQTARVLISEKGFEPARVTFQAGVPARITFVRTTEVTCGTEVAIPSLNMRRALPLNRPVDVDFTPQKTGNIEFACAMGMLKGTIVIQ